MLRKDAFVSVICPVRNAGSDLAARLGALSDVLSSNFQYYEIIVVDNASTDDTAARMKTILSECKNIQYCALSVQVSDTAAYSVGLCRAIGDFIVTMDITSDPPDRLTDLLALAAGGAEIVYGLPSDRLKGATIYDRAARLFLKTIARFNNVDIPAAMSTYRVFSRSVLNYILESLDHHRTLALAPALSGYSYKSLEYGRLCAGSSDARRRIGFKSALRALDLLFSTSVRPLRLVTVFAVGMSIVSVAYAAYVVITRLLMENVASGWATLSLQVSILFFFISIVLAVMCEYLLQILETSTRRPVYHVARELHSSTLDYEQDLNVCDAEGKTAEAAARQS